MHGLPLLYTGQRYDAEVDLYYYKNRQYDAKSGRFMSRDRIGYGDGPSPYQYGQSPLTLFDRSNTLPADVEYV